MISLLWTATAVAALGSEKSFSFATSKVRMYSIHQDMEYEKTVYCNCNYASKRVDLDGCGLHPRAGSSTGAANRYKQTEAEHMVPAAVLCGAEPGWSGVPKTPTVCTEKNKEAGRECAALIEPCSFAYTDIHNLWPAVGGLNADRSDRPYVQEVEGVLKQYGETCDFEVKFGSDEDTGVELPLKARGIAGRVSLYMYTAYNSRGLTVDFSDDQVAMFKRWNCNHRPSPSECLRNEKVKLYQGNYNHITKSACDNEEPADDPNCKGVDYDTETETETTTEEATADDKCTVSIQKGCTAAHKETCVTPNAECGACLQGFQERADGSCAEEEVTIPDGSLKIPFLGEQCPTVFFSQYFEEGSKKVIELFNYGDEAVQLEDSGLTGLYIGQYTTIWSDRKTNQIYLEDPSETTAKWKLSEIIPPRSVMLLGKGTSIADIASPNASVVTRDSVTFTYNGDDTLALLYDTDNGTKVCDLIACDDKDLCARTSYMRSFDLMIPTTFAHNFNGTDWIEIELSEVKEANENESPKLGYHVNKLMTTTTTTTTTAITDKKNSGDGGKQASSALGSASGSFVLLILIFAAVVN